MRKYWLIFHQYWQNAFVYRTSFLLWRLREFLSSLMVLTIWQVIFDQQQTAFGYQAAQMTAYVFLATILHNVIMTTALNNLAGDIYSGKISTLLVKPINIFLSWGALDLADKSLNLGFVILETSLLFYIFKPNFIWPDASVWPIFIFWVILAVILNFIINLLFGSLGFWSPDSWGPKFLFYMLVEFTAGKLYPLDILPTIIQRIIFYTPFPYLSYLQTQLFLGRINDAQLIHFSVVILAWILLLGLLFRYVWQKGIRNYTSMGQ